MKNRGSNPILTNLVGDHPRNIHTKFEANPCSGLRGEVEKLKSSRRQQRQRRQRQRQRRRRRRTQPDRYSHTHSLSVTKKPDMSHKSPQMKRQSDPKTQCNTQEKADTNHK